MATICQYGSHPFVFGSGSQRHCCLYRTLDEDYLTYILGWDSQKDITSCILVSDFWEKCLLGSAANATYVAKSLTLASREYSDSPSPKSDSLSSLPTELLQSIADFLPTSSAAALTLCNRTTFLKLGSKYLTSINQATVEPYTEWYQTQDQCVRPSPAQVEREKFLEQLSRDSLEFIYCYYCKKLHHPEKTGSDRNCTRCSKSIPFEQRRPCTQLERYQVHSSHLHGDFNHSRVQNLMKHYRHGRDYSNLLKPLNKTWTSYRDGFTFQQSVQCRVRNGRFMVRTQHWLLFAWANGPDVQLPDHYNLGLCPHLTSTGYTKYPGRLDRLLLCRATHPHCCECGVCCGVKACKDCPTEFQIDTKLLPEEDKMALVITTWRDFGKAQSPFEPEWEHQTHEMLNKVHPCPRFYLGEIKASYERFDFDAHQTPSMIRALQIKKAYSPTIYEPG